MKKYQFASCTYTLVVAALLVTTGCGSNLPNVTSASATAPLTVTYDAPIDKVWTTTQGILASEATFKILDKSSSIMVTEYKTIESQELSMIGTAFLGKTYKNNYTVTLQTVSPTRTTVRVVVGVQTQQVGFYTREADEPQASGYLRQKIFDKIGAGLK